MPDGEVMTDILHAWNAVKDKRSMALAGCTVVERLCRAVWFIYKKFSDHYFIESTDRFFVNHPAFRSSMAASEKPVSKTIFSERIRSTNILRRHYIQYADSIALYKNKVRIHRNGSTSFTISL